MLRRLLFIMILTAGFVAIVLSRDLNQVEVIHTVPQYKKLYIDISKESMTSRHDLLSRIAEVERSVTDPELVNYLTMRLYFDFLSLNLEDMDRTLTRISRETMLMRLWKEAQEALKTEFYEERYQVLNNELVALGREQISNITKIGRVEKAFAIFKKDIYQSALIAGIFITLVPFLLNLIIIFTLNRRRSNPVFMYHTEDKNYDLEQIEEK